MKFLLTQVNSLERFINRRLSSPRTELCQLALRPLARWHGNTTLRIVIVRYHKQYTTRMSSIQIICVAIYRHDEVAKTSTRDSNCSVDMSIFFIILKILILFTRKQVLPPFYKFVLLKPDAFHKHIDMKGSGE